MWLKMNWEDNRIKVKNNTKSNVAYDLKKSLVLTVHHDIIHHIWMPEWFIPHFKFSRVNHGVGFKSQMASVVIKDGILMVDHWQWLKLVTSCPMVFNWYPFDRQTCRIGIQVKDNKFILHLIYKMVDYI